MTFPQPPVGPAYDGYIRQQNARRVEWGGCIRNYHDDLTTVNKTFGLESANEWVKATRRFTCARDPKPNCIADGPYNAVAEIATDANVAYAKKREEFFSQERAKVSDLIERGNAWIEEVNRRIEVHNASQ